LLHYAKRLRGAIDTLLYLIASLRKKAPWRN
jgi:hypothetical protein